MFSAHLVAEELAAVCPVPCNNEGAGDAYVLGSYGTIDAAVATFQALFATASKREVGKECTSSRMPAGEYCVCPPGMVETPESCENAVGPQAMKFYMYRAQSFEAYDMENVNMGDLAGVMWYLHREVVASVPRKFDSSRILRFLATVKNPEEMVKRTSQQFGPFVAFDSGKCTVDGCNDIWSSNGFAVGCQPVDVDLYRYHRPEIETPDLCDASSDKSCAADKYPFCPKGAKKVKDLSKWTGDLLLKLSFFGTRALNTSIMAA
ncbi:unnamed protein product [Polarella glacialis]|uniref:Uncharacterized protein n=1 Tax=Polarella glacialis TaxID=89957 RepID=A0A813LSV4_POLGL|nr:unnamed protein product [Polarella glacialis]